MKKLDNRIKILDDDVNETSVQESDTYDMNNLNLCMDSDDKEYLEDEEDTDDIDKPHIYEEDDTEMFSKHLSYFADCPDDAACIGLTDKENTASILQIQRHAGGCYRNSVDHEALMNQCYLTAEPLPKNKLFALLLLKHNREHPWNNTPALMTLVILIIGCMDIIVTVIDQPL